MTDPLTRLPGVGFRHKSEGSQFDCIVTFPDGSTLAIKHSPFDPNYPDISLRVGIGHWYIRKTPPHTADRWFRCPSRMSWMRIRKACDAAEIAHNAWAELAEREYPSLDSPCAGCVWACCDIGEVWCEVGRDKAPLKAGDECAMRQTGEDLAKALEAGE